MLLNGEKLSASFIIYFIELKPILRKIVPETDYALQDQTYSHILKATVYLNLNFKMRIKIFSAYHNKVIVNYNGSNVVFVMIIMAFFNNVLQCILFFFEYLTKPDLKIVLKSKYEKFMPEQVLTVIITNNNIMAYLDYLLSK